MSDRAVVRGYPWEDRKPSYAMIVSIYDRWPGELYFLKRGMVVKGTAIFVRGELTNFELSEGLIRGGWRLGGSRTKGWRLLTPLEQLAMAAE